MPIILTFKQISASELFKLAAKERNRQLKRRLLGIALSVEGRLSREAVAEQLKTDSDRIRAWIRRYNQDGLDGLRDRPGRGDKPTLTPRQEQALAQALARSPRAARINSNLWTGRAVQEFLAKKGWFECSLASAYVIIHRLGFTLQRPSCQSLEADPHAAKCFLRQLAGEKKATSSSRLSSGRRGRPHLRAYHHASLGEKRETASHPHEMERATRTPDTVWSG